MMCGNEVERDESWIIVGGGWVVSLGRGLVRRLPGYGELVGGAHSGVADFH